METLKFVLFDFWDEYADPRSRHLPLMSGPPYRVIALVAFYILLVKVVGPQLMRNREPFQLRTFMFVYNCVLIGFNTMGVVLSLWITDMMVACWDCSPIDTVNYSFKKDILTYFGWAYFMSKFFDWMDTVFFVLRKKHNQASFLHIFHHSIMPLIAWFGLKFHPSPYSSFLPVFNAFVHAVMYTYYALSCSGPDLKKHTWFKKYMTQLQLLQFLLTFVHAMNAIVRSDCYWPKWLATLEALNASLFIYMFGQFYLHSYIRNKAVETKAREAGEIDKKSQFSTNKKID